MSNGTQDEKNGRRRALASTSVRTGPVSQQLPSRRLEYQATAILDSTAHRFSLERKRERKRDSIKRRVVVLGCGSERGLAAPVPFYAAASCWPLVEGGTTSASSPSRRAFLALKSSSPPSDFLFSPTDPSNSVESASGLSPLAPLWPFW